MKEVSVSTVMGSANIIEGSGRACILLPMGTQFDIADALHSPKSNRNLLSFKDIRRNGYHIETVSEGKVEYLHITRITQGSKAIVERLPAFSTGLYFTNINTIEANIAVHQKLLTGHQKLSVVHQKCNENFNVWHDRLGHPGTGMMRKIIINSCGHSLQNQKILPNDFTCAACAQGKLIIRPSPAKMIARPLLMRSQLPVSAWGHAILHAATLIRIRPTSNHKFSPLQLVLGKEPNISHLKVFGCTVYVPIAPPQRSKMGPQGDWEYMLDMILHQS
ncbi:unnamed protein product [Microthlaspi erraticum]|uniref:GAG-pre-integrase domain-containing protein n=1 Tax=Microthlaspi erraticum TaxID=1685480 RepID=A0A6D2JWT8_9BRAS|nr:unnamed protein product [Microthlaspi erraticum]